MTLKNTEENAEITMISRSYAGGEEDKIEFKTDGGFYIKDGRYYITYRENEEMGMGSSRVLLKIEPNVITMRRMGEFSTVMVYKLNEITEFIYRVPFGELNLKIKTESMANSLTEVGGCLKFGYTIFAGGEQTKNRITLTVKTKGA